MTIRIARPKDNGGASRRSIDQNLQINQALFIILPGEVLQTGSTFSVRGERTSLKRDLYALACFFSHLHPLELLAFFLDVNMTEHQRIEIRVQLVFDLRPCHRWPLLADLVKIKIIEDKQGGGGSMAYA